MGVIKTFFNEYLVRLSMLKVNDVIEILIIAFVIYYFFKWVQTTNAWAVIRGLGLLLICWLIAYIFDFHAIQWVFVNALGVGITAFIILFHPELRKVLEQLGKQHLMSPLLGPADAYNSELTAEDVEEIVRGVYSLAREKTGALIVFEQQISLSKIIETGIALDSKISAGILISIFEDKKPLHDGAVIVRGNRIAAATCYLPLSENMQLSKDMGTRHRAGVGISETTDSFTIIISEETGKVSVARAGEITRGVSGDYLKEQLLSLARPETSKKVRFGIGKKEKSL